MSVGSKFSHLLYPPTELNSRFSDISVSDVRFSIWLFLATFVTLHSTSLSAASIIGASDVEIVARLTGANSINHTDTVGIGGTDLGHMVNHNGYTYFLFGDTFAGINPGVGGDWRSNVMSYSTDTNPSDGILFDDWIKDQSGRAREVVHSGRTSPITEIPTGAVSIGNRIYSWYMAVNWWGPPGEWTTNYAGLAYWEEGFDEFTIVDDFEFTGNSNFGMVSPSLEMIQ